MQFDDIGSAGRLCRRQRPSPALLVSAARAAADERYGVAVWHVAEIWPDREDGRWLYSENWFGEAAREFWYSETYQKEILPLREGIAEFEVLVLPALPVPDYID